MNTYRPTQASSYWMVALKLLILILGLYLSAVILGKLFTLVFAIAFFLIRLIVFVSVSLIVLHFFLKILFNFDLFRFVTGRQFRHH